MAKRMGIESISWGTLRDLLLVVLGGLLQAVSLHYFLVPSGLVGGGEGWDSGLAFPFRIPRSALRV